MVVLNVRVVSPQKLLEEMLEDLEEWRRTPFPRQAAITIKKRKNT